MGLSDILLRIEGGPGGGTEFTLFHFMKSVLRLLNSPAISYFPQFTPTAYSMHRLKTA